MQDRPDTYAAPLYEGTFSVGQDKKFFPIGRDDSPAKGALKISLNPFLIKTTRRNYLFDVGIGEFGEDTSTKTLRENLGEHGLTEYDVTDIFCSHLHYDHIGGLAGRTEGYWELTFPETRIWVSKSGWDKVTARETYYDQEKTEFIHFLDAKADLHFLDDTAEPYPEIRVEKIGGHTEFSQVLYFDDGDQKYLMAGDVLATRGAINRKYAAKFDFDPKQSMNARAELTDKAYREHYTIMGYHDSHHPLFRLTGYDERQGYKMEHESRYVST